MTIFTVGTAAELDTALSSATGGDRIEMKAGNYGDVSINGQSFASGVTIAAQNSGNPPVFNTMDLTGCSNLKLDGLKFNFQPDANTMEWTTALEVRNSTGISVTNSTFTGGNAIVGTGPNAAAGTQGNQGIIGYPVGRGMAFLNSSDLTLTGNKMTGFTHSIRLVNVDDAVVSNNDVGNFRKCPISGSDLNGITVQDNYFHDANAWKYGPKGDHGDFIHFWSTNKQPTASHDFLIKGNYFEQGNGTPLMGVFINTPPGSKGFQNVVIDDNIIHTSNGQGIRAEGIDGLQILHNSILASVANLAGTPKIILDYGNQHVFIDQNILTGIGGNQLSNAGSSQIVLGHNITVQTKNPGSPDYVGNIFTDALNALPHLSGFAVKPGSIGMGYGADPAGGTTTWGGTSTAGVVTLAAVKIVTADIAAVDSSSPIKISATNDSLQFTKILADKAVTTVQIADKVLPKVNGDMIDFGAITKAIPVEHVKVTMDHKFFATDNDGDQQAYHNDSAPLVTDHFAFVDGHFVGIHI